MSEESLSESETDLKSLERCAFKDITFKCIIGGSISALKCFLRNSSTLVGNE